MLLPLLAPLLFAATRAAADPPQAAPVFSGPDHFVEEGGRSVYAHVCAGCHMPTGKGAAGAGAYPSLAGDTRLAAVGYPITIVLHGQKAMPPFGDYLTDRQVADVVNYVRRHFGNRYDDKATVEEVKTAR
jgi:mono/diheme cytochrome c family protein